MGTYKILTINPGSTSTKIAIFEGGRERYSENISHDAQKLAEYQEVSQQLPYRKEMINRALKKSELSMDGFSAVVGRGGGLMPVEGGVYSVNEKLLEHARVGANGVRHPAQLGPQLAKEFADLLECPAFVVNPPDTDELCDYARVTGIKGVYRNVHLHALNLKETAIQHAASLGKRYEACNFVVCHIGGGISVSAHQKGRMIDGNDIVGGEGPLAPTRCGAIPAIEMLNCCLSGMGEKELKGLCMKNGGFVSHLGTSDAKEVAERANKGEKLPALLWNTMIYQITKEIGAMAAVLHGQIDGVLLGGGMVRDVELVEKIKEACGYLGPITAYPGEFEMEAMASGATRALDKVEAVKEYTGEPVWNRSAFEA